MLDVSTTVKRIAMALLGACLLMLGTPLLGVTPARAGTPSGPVTISAVGFFAYYGAGLQAFSNLNAEPSHFIINATEPGPGYDAVASMQMTLQDTTVNSAPRLMQTLTAAPWMFGVDGTDGVAGNTQQLVFTAFNISNVALTSYTMNAMFRTNPKAQITAPTGNVITLDSSGNANMSGTSSQELVGVQFNIRDNSTGNFIFGGNIQPTTTASTWSASGVSVNWSMW